MKIVGCDLHTRYRQVARCPRFPPGFWAVTWEPRRYALHVCRKLLIKCA
jgi:hypothetical protein